MSQMTEITVDVTQSVQIDCDLETAWEELLKRLTCDNAGANDQPMPMVLEQRPGGRWFRDLGNDQGHLWGFVQVIKAPQLLEITGPLFMSYAIASHLQFRLVELDKGVEIQLRHNVLGEMPEDHRVGIQSGWGRMLEQIKARVES